MAIMYFSKHAAFLIIAAVSKTIIAGDVNAGYNVYAAAEIMTDAASHSWEWGTAAEALLELYNGDLSVFGSNPFPNGNIPHADPSITALAYAKQYILTNSQTLVSDTAVGDPASLGVSAILLGQSDSTYIDAANRQADYILNQAPKFWNGAISQRPDVAELWADNMAMSFPFLAYLAVQQKNPSLMAETVTQCGLYRDILKSSSGSWQHIIGPQSQDTGLWSTGNGWAAYGMTRVLHTLQKWSGSSSMTSQASQLKGWIKEILDGTMSSPLSNGLLLNYLGDTSWFGEISGTALLTAVAYRMAVNDPVMFPQKYINWADTNRKSLSSKEAANGVFSPAVDPYSWFDRTEYTNGSPEGQAFTVYMYTAYRDCVNSGKCQASTTPLCGTPGSCDSSGCSGSFVGLAKYPQCTNGCQCTATSNTCGARQSCDLNGCAGAFNGLVVYAQCTGNFVGCQCTATANTCGSPQSCYLNGCAGTWDQSIGTGSCRGNFVGCPCNL